jgi:hypothetical protein
MGQPYIFSTFKFIYCFTLQVKVMHKQLLLLHNAVSAYFSGNQQALEATMKQFSINVKSPNSNTPSWIEQ